MSRPRRKPRSRHGAARYAAPAAFLLGVTIAVLLIRAGLENGGGTPATTRGPVTTRPAPTTTSTRTVRTGAAQFYTVQSGDTFGTIAAKEGISVAQLEELNPGVSSNALRVGQRLRVK